MTTQTQAAAAQKMIFRPQPAFVPALPDGGLVDLAFELVDFLFFEVVFMIGDTDPSWD